MRMRKKRRLEPRMEALLGLLLARGRPCLNLKEAAENYRAPLNYAEIFGNARQVELEIGCGNGAFIAELSRREEKNFLAVEVVTNVIVTAMERVAREGIDNVRFLNIPAEILPCYIPRASISRIYLNFSTPLPEPSRARQRLTSPRFLAIYSDLLQAGGEIVQKTDSEEFFEDSLRNFEAAGFDVVSVDRDLPAGGDNIVTEYEAAFRAQGKPIFRAVAKRRGV